MKICDVSFFNGDIAGNHTLIRINDPDNLQLLKILKDVICYSGNGVYFRKILSDLNILNNC